jgi:hypothetical protein
MLDINSYLETALWASEGEDLFTGEEYLANLEKELEEFWDKTSHLYSDEEIEMGHIEHDFFLTRNGHGAGFWDGDYDKGIELSEIAKSFGEDDGE